MPESMQGMRRTTGCGNLRRADAGKKVTLMGWVQRRRDHGGLIFVDMRDRTGIVQVVFNPDNAVKAFKKAEMLRNEYVLAVTGEVGIRPAGTENPNLATGEIEVYAREARILNEAKTPPFYIEDGIDVDENIRLRYQAAGNAKDFAAPQQGCQGGEGFFDRERFLGNRDAHVD